MKNFDADRKLRRRSEEERTFVLGGEVFVMKSGIHPSVMESYDTITEESTVAETMEIVDDLIVNMIESKEDARARYAMVRAETDDPVTIEDLQELVTWMVETQTARPTGRPGDSSAGPERTPTPLTDISSGKEEPVATTA